MDLEDLWAVEPSLRSGFYIQPISLLNHIETSKTVSNLYVNLKTNRIALAKSEKTLDDTACMDSMFTMSIHTPRRYILELLLIQSALTFWEAQRHNTKINKCGLYCN